MAFDSLTSKLNEVVRDIQGKGHLTDANMEDMLKKVRLALLEADVNYKVVKQFLDSVREKAKGEKVLESVEPGQQLVKIVHDELVILLGEEQTQLNKELPMTKIMVVGLQGTGKTTSLAKLANQLKKEEKKILLVAGDTQRPAAIEQLKTLGKSINVEVFAMDPSVGAREVVKHGLAYAQKNYVDYLLVDTAGRLHVDDELMQEVKDIQDMLQPSEVLLTVDAMTGQDIVTVAQSFSQTLNVSGLIATKFDGDARGGGVLSVKTLTNVPIKFVGIGEKIDEFEPFYPQRMADRILGFGDIVSLVEKAQETMDQKKAEESAKRLLDGTFTMDDMLFQLESVNKMGSLGSLVKMIPGLNRLADQINDEQANAQMKKTKAIIQSMTPSERKDPSRLRSTHKRRIAAGSGTSVNDVNKVFNNFERMKKAMGMMGRMSKGAMKDFLK